MVNITQCELEKLVGQYRSSISKPKKRMVCEYCSQAHCPRMENSFPTETTQACMTMHDLDLFSNDDVAEDGKE